MSTGAERQQNDEGGGERTAERLFVENYAFMFATARKSLKQKADAEDVIQTLFFKLADSELPENIWDDPKGYLYRTVINACHDWRKSRKSKRERQRVEELEFIEPRSEQANANAFHEVEHLLSGLDKGVARIVMLHAESGMSDAEIRRLNPSRGFARLKSCAPVPDIPFRAPLFPELAPKTAGLSALWPKLALESSARSAKVT